MTAHRHAEMIKTKADNVDLVVFTYIYDQWKELERVTHWDNKQYFICLPKHKKECLHWLNGGEVQGRRCSLNWTDIYGNPVKVITYWVDIYGSEEWDKRNLFMSDYYEFRIKPNKDSEQKERQFNEGEWYPCLDKDGDPCVCIYRQGDFYTSCAQTYSIAQPRSMKWIGESLGEIKFG